MPSIFTEYKLNSVGILSLLKLMSFISLLALAEIEVHSKFFSNFWLFLFCAVRKVEKSRQKP
jgi:hypothetical protein